MCEPARVGGDFLSLIPRLKHTRARIYILRYMNKCAYRRDTRERDRRELLLTANMASTSSASGRLNNLLSPRPERSRAQNSSFLVNCSSIINRLMWISNLLPPLTWQTLPEGFTRSFPLHLLPPPSFPPSNHPRLVRFCWLFACGETSLNQRFRMHRYTSERKRWGKVNGKWLQLYANSSFEFESKLRNRFSRRIAKINCNFCSASSLSTIHFASLFALAPDSSPFHVLAHFTSQAISADLTFEPGALTSDVRFNVRITCMHI